MEEVAWLTGCASGVGRRLADGFLRRGYRVVASDLRAEGLGAAADELGWDPGRVLVTPLDVRDARGWESVYRALMRRWGRLDWLFNVAGVIRPGWLVDATPADVDLHLDVNFKGTVHGSRLAARHMAAVGGGHIVNLSSLAGVAPVPGLGLYSASKFAVRAYSLVLAQELASVGVAVTVVCPDAIETPMLAAQVDHDEAALTFSGPRALTLDEIEALVFDRVLPRRPLEILVPGGRGLQARAAGLFPHLSGLMLGRLRRRGIARLRRRRHGAGGPGGLPPGGPRR